MERMAKLDYEKLNSTTRYMMISVFAVNPGELGEDRGEVVDDVATFFKQQQERGVEVRGLYDVAGMRADADYMVWTHAERIEDLQAAYTGLRRTLLGRVSEPVWSAAAVGMSPVCR